MSNSTNDTASTPLLPTTPTPVAETTYHVVQNYYFEHVHHARVYAPIVAVQALLLLFLLSCLCLCLCRCARLNTQQQPRVFSPREISEASQRLLTVEDGVRRSSTGGSAKKKQQGR